MTYGQHRRAVRRVRNKGRFTPTAIGDKHAWRALKREIGARQARMARKEARQRERIAAGRATDKDLTSLSASRPHDFAGYGARKEAVQ